MPIEVSPALPIGKICSKIKLSFCFRKVENKDSKQILHENNCMRQMFSVKNWEATMLIATGENGFFFGCSLVEGRGLRILIKCHPASSSTEVLFRSSLKCKRACVWLYVCVFNYLYCLIIIIYNYYYIIFNYY